MKGTKYKGGYPDAYLFLDLGGKAKREVKRNRLTSSRYRERKAKVEPSYEGLDGEWQEWLEVAKRFEHKAKTEDRLDLRHTIIVTFADQQARNERLGKPDLSFYGMLRIASHCVADYWRELKRNARLIDLNMVIADDEGNSVELIDTLADDKAIDLDQWLDDTTFRLGCPMRLIQIAHKKRTGTPLSWKDHKYWERTIKKERERYQLTLF